MNKSLLILSILLLLIVPINVVADIVDQSEIGEDMVAGGLDQFVTNTADSIIGFVTDTEVTNASEHYELGDEPLNSSVCHGESAHDFPLIDPLIAITDAIIAFASWTVTPFSYPTVLSFMGVSLALGIGFLVAYALAGVLNTMTASTGYGQYSALKNIMGSGTRDNSINNYGKNIVSGCFGLLFAVPLIQLSLWFAESLKYMMMTSIADSISPSLSSIPVLYLAMAIMWLCLSLFFGISNMVICLIASFSLILGALYGSDRTRHVTTWCADYFFTMMMMQVFVIAVTVVVVGVISDFKTGGGYGALLYALPGAEFTLYVGLIGGLVYMCYRFTLGKTRLLSIATKAIKFVV